MVEEESPKYSWSRTSVGKLDVCVRSAVCDITVCIQRNYIVKYAVHT